MKSSTDLWDMTRSFLEQEISPVTIAAWFDDIEAIDFTGNRLVLYTPSEFKKQIIEERFMVHVKKALKDLFFADIEVTITNVKQLEEVLAPSSPNDEYTFEQFIVGQSNKLAHAAAIAVSNNPGKNYNPLFIYGQSGLGKTHLLYSISTVIRRNNPNAKIIYIKGEDFTNELVSAIGDATVSSFREKYRMADLLLVDDIQFVAGKERTQEEFFHTFNALYESNKQIVLTSDRPPKEINTLEDRLKTRFEWGLLTDIQPPDYETRLAILKAKANYLEINIPEPILKYIANTITSNVRQLEGTVKKIVALNQLMGREVTEALASEAIRDIFKESPGLNPTPKIIMGEVCNYYNISVDKMASNNRSKENVLPRQVAMYLIRQMTTYSLPEIGKVLSRDHTTILHGINRIEELLASSKEMENTIEIIKTNIKSL